MRANKLRAFCIFDDFPVPAKNAILSAGFDLDILPRGNERPRGNALKKLLEDYDAIIIGTAQKIEEDFFENITTPKFIATTSVGTDHIHIPAEKSHLVKIFNAPGANHTTVAEHIFTLALTLEKRLNEARATAEKGLAKKVMSHLPEDIAGKTIGLVGFGAINQEVAQLATALKMKIQVYTKHPEKYSRYSREREFSFVDLDCLLKTSDIIAVAIPATDETQNLISREKIKMMKNDSTFISVSRAEIIELDALFEKARGNAQFKIGLDVESSDALGKWTCENHNIIVTPHTAGGTTQSRMRLFEIAAENLARGACIPLSPPPPKMGEIRE